MVPMEPAAWKSVSLGQARRLEGDTCGHKAAGDDATPILRLEQFSGVPTINFKEGVIGSHVSCLLLVQNNGLLTQELEEDSVPRNRGFFLHDHEANPVFQRHARPGQPWRIIVGPNSSVLVRLTWEPTQPGRCRETLTFKWQGKHRLQAVLLGTGTLYKSRKVSKLSDASSPHRPLGLLSANVRLPPPRAILTKPVSPKLGRQNPRFLAHLERQLSQAERRHGDGQIEKRALAECDKVDYSQPQGRLHCEQSDEEECGKNVRSAGDHSGSTAGQVTSTADVEDLIEAGESCSTDVNDKAQWLSDPAQTAMPCQLMLRPRAVPALSVKRQLYVQQEDSDSEEDDVVVCNMEIGSSKRQYSEITRSASSVSAQALNAQSLTQKLPVMSGGPLKGKLARHSDSSFRPPQIVASADISIQRRHLKLRPGCNRASMQLGRGPGESSEKRTVSFFHGELWMEKQMRAYTSWLNHLLAEPLPYCGETQQTRVAGMQDRRMSLGQLGKLRAEERVRQRIWYAYARDDQTVAAMIRVEKHIDAGHLRMLEGCPLVTDVALRSKAIQAVMSYDPFWLRLGLEAVLGASVEGASEAALQEVLEKQLLHDSHLAAEYATNKQVDGLFRPGYPAAVGRSVLKKFLLLVLLLDRVQEMLRSSLPLPLLFRKESLIKSSACVVREFLSGCLSGEGDVLRHLAALGYHLTHQQAAVYEVDFQVSNMAVDLRDGLRLVRLAHLLTGDPTPLQNVRAPAANRAACLHNCQLALTALAHGGLALGLHGPSALQLTAADVVDGRRDRTLQLLWQIMLHWQVPALIDTDKLREEIELVHKQRRIHQLIHGCPPSTEESASVYMASDHLDLLLQWVQAVCSGTGVNVRNFTTSFADGRALCLVLSHYLPAVLSTEDILAPPEAVSAPSPETSAAPGDGMSNGWSARYAAGPGEEECNAVQAAKSVAARKNFALLHAAVAQLGGVPQILEHSDMADGNLAPTERIIITYVAFLCSRLLDIRTEAKAATLLQRAWRRHHRGLCLRRWIAAATRIQAAFRGWKQRTSLREKVSAARMIQGHWRSLVARRSFTALKVASLTIQCAVRAWEARGRYAELHVLPRVLQRGLERALVLRQGVYERRMTGPVISIQAAYRGAKARHAVRAMHSAATVLQARWRAHVAKAHLNSCKRAAIVVQAVWQGVRVRRHVARMERSVLIIQREWRRRCAQAGFRRLRERCVVVQAIVRGRRERTRFVALRRTAVLIQSLWRGAVVRAQKRGAISAVVRIQAQWRAYSQRRTFLHHVAGIRRLQATWRSYVARASFLQLRGPVLLFQAHWRGRAVRQRLMSERQAARSIQAVWRGVHVRREVALMRGAALVIQSRWRGVVQVRNLRTAARRVVVFQAAVRRCLAVRAWQAKLAAVVKIQAAFRGHVVRSDVRRADKAAHVIQNGWRGHLQVQWFRRTVRNVTVIQAAVRRWAVRKSLRLQTAAAVRIQGAYRGHLARAALARAHTAARVIQGQWRGYWQLQRYRQAVQNVTLVQASVRRWGVRRRLRKQSSAAVRIQAVYKGHLARAALARAHAAATLIQSLWRRNCQVKRFRQAVRKVTVVQASVRRWGVQRLQRQQGAAAVRIQAHYKGHLARSALARAHAAARLIQLHWRVYLQHECFRDVVQNVILVQASVRRWAVRKVLREQVAAAVRVQAAFRGHLARRALARANVSAQFIQRRWRVYLERQRLKEMVRKVTLVQASIRRWAVRKSLQKQRAAAVQIQAAYRGRRARGVLARVHSAAQLIQSRWRAYSHQQRFRRTVRNVVLIQAATRRWAAVNALKTLRGAAVICQSAWRGARARARFLRVRRAAVTIQSHYRGHMQRAEFGRMRETVVKLQARARMVLDWRAVVRVSRAALYCQAVRRGGLVRRSLDQWKLAATVIQVVWRGYRARQNLRLHIRAAVVIQSRIRGRSTRLKFAAARERLVLLQAAVRGRQTRQLFKRLRNGALCLQSVWRGRCARVYVSQLRATVCLQAAWRGFRVRKRVRTWNEAATCIQRHVRGGRERRQYLRLKWAVTLSQSCARGALDRAKFLCVRIAAVKVQACWRGRRVRVWQAERHVAAVSIQAFVKGRRERQAFQKTRAAAVLIQGRVRSQQATAAYRQLKRAAVVLQAYWRGRQARGLAASERGARIIQAFWRGACARAEIRKWHEAATLIARVWKGSRERKKWLRLRGPIVRLQAMVRGVSARRQWARARAHVVVIQSLWRRRAAQKAVASIRQRQAAAVCLQKNWRMHAQRRYFAKLREGVVIIQATWKMRRESKKWNQVRVALIRVQARWRGALTRRQLARDAAVTTAGRAAIKVQRAWRRFVATRVWREERLAAAVVIQRAVRAVLVRVQYVRLRAAVLRLQSLWRGHVVRRSTTSRQRAARQRIERATARLEEPMTLGSRTTAALRVLLASKQVSHALHACAAIDMSTRLSPVCCERIAANSAVPTLLRFIQSCNRSTPHLQLLKHGLSILRNLCKHRSLVAYVVEAPDCVNILVEQLQMYRDKEDVFGLALETLRLICRDPQRAELIRAMPGIVFRLDSIASILSRKVQLDARQTASSKQVASLMSLIQRLKPASVAAATPHPSSKRRAFVSVGTPGHGLASRPPFRDVTNVKGRQLKFKHQD